MYVLQKKMPLVGSKWKERVVFTETNGLAPEFLEQMRGTKMISTSTTDQKVSAVGAASL